MDYANFMLYLGILIFIILVIAGIIYAHKVAQKEQELRLLITKSKRLLLRANDVWEITQDASKFVGDVEIINTLVQYYAYVLNQREQLFPQQDTGGLLAKADAFNTRYNPIEHIVELKNDHEINHCKETFVRTGKILKAAASKNIIHNDVLKDLEHKLKHTLLQIEVNAYEKLGDQAGANKNPAEATTYYKYAKKLLIESDVIYPDKHEHIRSITEKNQILFGNIIKEKMSVSDNKSTSENEFGLPNDLNVMSGKARKEEN